MVTGSLNATIYVDDFSFAAGTGGGGGTAPTANFTASQTAGTLSVAFTDTSTGSPTSWSWDFDSDGTVDSTQQHSTHTFAAADTYQVTLTATNTSGTNSVTKGVVVAPVSSGTPPTANFTASQTAGTLSVAFTDTSTGSPTSWSWDFDGNATVDSTVRHPTHSYAAAGSYNVTLTATNAAGSHSVTKAVSVSEPPSGGSNLLANPDFETDANNDTRPDAWTSNNNFSRAVGAGRNGSAAGRWQSTTNNGPSSYQQVEVSAGTTYAVSGWVNAPTTADAFTFEIKVLWRNSSGAISSTVVKKYTDDTNGAWQQVSGSVAAPAGATLARVQMVTGSLNATIYVDDFSFAVLSGS
jgi:PKD repeat protein